MTPEQAQAYERYINGLASRDTYSWRKYSVADRLEALPDEIAEQEKIVRANRFIVSIEQDGPIQPVMLTVTLTRAEYKRLMADDDHLRINAGSDEKDWRGSLGQFAQIAYRGSIPPERLQVVEKPKVW